MKDNSGNRKSETALEWWPTFLLISAAVVIPTMWVLWWFHAPKLLKQDYKDAGVFGDMFGALNTLFTGFAFVGVIYTILLQRKQLKMLRDELDDTREATKHQQFESTFFQLLDLLTRIVESLRLNSRVGDFRSPQYIVKEGRNVLWQYANQLIISYLQHPPTGDLSDAERREHIAKRYGEFYEPHATALAHYFRVLYRILKLIETTDIPNQLTYAKILRAQLSEQELVLLFYNSFIPEGKKMQRFLEKFSLLKHLPAKSLAHPNDRQLYPEVAYVELQEV